MADGIETFSQTKNLARVKAGLMEKGPFYNSPNTPKPMNFEDGYPDVYNEKVMGAKVEMGPIQDVWIDRKSNSSMKK